MRISQCRLCSSRKVEKIVDLGFHPLADTFLHADTLYDTPETHYPLQLGKCFDCGHVFTLFAVSQEDRYQKYDYSYDSSNSTVSINHFKDFAQAVIAQGNLSLEDLIVDIGSNVGTLLNHFQSLGYKNVLGVEPSDNISKIAKNLGVPTITDFFCGRVVKQLRQSGSVKCLLSANVINHADDFSAVIKTALEILDEDGIFVFEVPYLLDLVQKTAFDTIYHEHVHYHAVQPLSRALAAHGFSIFKVERIDYMCGSIRVYARIGGDHAKIVNELIDIENQFHLFELDTWQDFMNRVRDAKISVITNLMEIRAKGGKIVGIGAATKGNTFINYCGLDSDTISYITDSSPLKIGKLTPGSHIPIIGDDSIDKEATHALILPWNIAQMLQDKLSHLGLIFYVPQVKTII